MPRIKPKLGAESDEVYQIRLNNALKSKFMEGCHDLALNPSAVLRKLMEDWTEKNGASKRRAKT